MKNFFFLVMIHALVSCNNQLHKNEVEIVKRKIDPILEKLLSKYPNYEENSIVRENATEELDKKIDSILNFGYLDDIPLKVFKIGKNPHGKGALIQFHTDGYNRESPELLSNRLNFDIIGLMDEKLASTLNDDGTYYVYGKNLKRLNETEVFLIVKQVYYSPGTEISKDAIYDVYEYDIGNIMMEIDSVKFIK